MSGKAVAHDQEAAPLIAAPEKAQRRWRNNWMMLFGDGSPMDVAACCLTYNVPCVSFAWNQNRGLQLNFWLEGFRFLLFTVGSFMLVHLISCLSIMMACPHPPPGGYHGDHHSVHGHWEHPNPDDEVRPMMDPDQERECMMRASPGLLAAAAIGLALLAFFIHFAAVRRSALRERFGIEGTYKGDSHPDARAGP
eukprot:gene13216-19053_t